MNFRLTPKVCHISRFSVFILKGIVFVNQGTPFRVLKILLQNFTLFFYLSFYIFASPVLVWLHWHPLLSFSACVYFRLLELLLSLLCFSPLSLSDRDLSQPVSCISPLISIMYFSVSMCGPLFLPVDVYLILPPTRCSLCDSPPSLRLFFYLSVHPWFFFSSSSWSLPISPCQSVFVLHCSCLFFVFLPVSNITYFLPSFSVNKSFPWVPPPPFTLLPLGLPWQIPLISFPLSLLSLCSSLSLPLVPPSLLSLAVPPCHSLSLNRCLDYLCLPPLGSLPVSLSLFSFFLFVYEHFTNSTVLLYFKLL